MTWTKEQMRTWLEQAKGRGLFQALWTLFQRQTATEQTTNTTQSLNGVGFTGFDAKTLSRLAQRSAPYQSLTPKQCPWVRRKLLRYRRQLAEAANQGEWHPTPPQPELPFGINSQEVRQARGAYVGPGGGSDEKA